MITAAARGVNRRAMGAQDSATTFAAAERR